MRWSRAGVRSKGEARQEPDQRHSQGRPAATFVIGIEGSAFIRYASGFLLFSRGTTLMAQPFDASNVTLSGDAAPVAEQIQVDVQTGSVACTVSDNGTLAFQVGGGAGSRLVWFDRNGKRLAQLGDVARYGSEVHLSPDGGRATVVSADAGVARDVWIFDVKRGVRTKLTFDAADDREPIWSPDGKRIIFNSNRKDARDLFQKDSSGAGEETVLLEDSFQKWPESVSPDGRFLLYAILGAGPQESNNDVWVLPLTGDRKPHPYLQSRGVAELRSQFSPDGRWVAYASDETGQFEVYVRPFPGPGGKWLVSTSGGHDPRWRRDGKELFYVTDKQMMSVPVTASAASFEVGMVKALFDIPPTPTEQGRAVFDVSPDGQRFLVNVTSEEGIAPITIVVNWPSILRK
jgi:hypothetical protein